MSFNINLCTCSMDLQMNKGAHFFGTYVGFKKREEHLITYKSEISRSQIDFFGKQLSKEISLIKKLEDCTRFT